MLYHLMFSNLALLGVRGAKRARITSVERQPSVRVIYNSLTRFEWNLPFFILLNCLSKCSSTYLNVMLFELSSFGL